MPYFSSRVPPEVQFSSSAVTPVPDSAPQRRFLSQRRIQMVLGLLWLLDAGLQFQPYMFTKGFVTQFLVMNAMYQPDVIGQFIIALSKILVVHPAIWNGIFATIQLVIGLGLLWRRTVRLALTVSFVWVLSVWAIGEGFGRLFTGTATLAGGAPGAVLLYGLIGLLVWPTSRINQGSTHSSVAGDGLLGERGGRISWSVLWFVGAIVQILPGPYPPVSVLLTTINMNLPEPGVLRHLDMVTNIFIERAGPPLVLVLVVVETLIGVYIWRGERWVRPVLWTGILLSLTFWAVGQNFGGIFAGNATDPNSGPLFVLLALTLYPRKPHATAQDQPTMKEPT